MNTPSAIDSQALENLRELNPEDDSFVRELVDLFLADIPLRIAELDGALAAANLPLVVRAAHTIKGSCSNFGARELARIAETIEQHGKAGRLGEVPPLVVTLKAEKVRVGEALHQYVGSLGTQNAAAS